jgi:5-hydroxyisourate hydrolase
MGSITTHVLDTTQGRPAAGVRVTLEFQLSEQEWQEIGKGTTDADGRIRSFTATELIAGIYRLTFDVQRAFYPQVVVVFRVENPKEHYHIPLLLGAFGYTTYRGS